MKTVLIYDKQNKCFVFLRYSVVIYRVAQKSKLLMLAVSEIDASQTRVSFAKFIPKLVEKMFDMCSIVPNYSFSILNFLLRSYLLY